MEDSLITIATYDNVFEAELAKALLEESGFKVYLLNERIMGILSTVAGDLYRIELQVSTSDEEGALRILETLGDESFTRELLSSSGALLEGHFLLTSGKHSDKYVEKIRILQKAESAAMLCRKMAERISRFEFDAIVGPAYGGIALAFETARIMGKDFIFTQRKDEQMTIRSGFDLSEIHKVAIIEDVVTTGGSVLEVIQCLKERNIEVVVIAALVDRCGGKVDFGVTFEALLTLDIPIWDADTCALCASGIELVKPGASDKKPIQS